MQRNYLVIDLDNCTIGHRKKTDEFLSKATDHLLSPEIINRAREKKYDGFIVCTHRCYSNDAHNITTHLTQLENILNYTSILKTCAEASKISPEEFVNRNNIDKKIVGCFPDFSEINTDSEFVSVIIENVKNATGLPCIAVSTPDDANGKCGSGFAKILKPYETAVLKTKTITRSAQGIKTEFDFAPNDFKLEQAPVTHYDSHTKNPQLKSIAQLVKSMHPEDKISLDYVDDDNAVLDNACRLASHSLPIGVQLHIHHHDAFGKTPILRLTSITGTMAVKDMSIASIAVSSPLSSDAHEHKLVSATRIHYTESKAILFSSGTSVTSHSSLAESLEYEADILRNIIENLYSRVSRACKAGKLNAMPAVLKKMFKESSRDRDSSPTELFENLRRIALLHGGKSIFYLLTSIPDKPNPESEALCRIFKEVGNISQLRTSPTYQRLRANYKLTYPSKTPRATSTL